MDLLDVKGLGKVTKEELHNENINTIDELLFHFPSSYEIYEFNMDKLFTGEVVTVKGFCDSKPVLLKYRKNVFQIIFYANINGIRMKCILFSSDYIRYKLFKGIDIVLYGRYKREENEFLVRRIFFDDFEKKIEVNYSYKNIKSYQIQKIVKSIYDTGYSVKETLPLDIISRYKLYDINELIYKSHLPENKADVLQINRRRKYEEFFFYAMSFHLLKSLRSKSIKDKRNIDYDLIHHFIESIPFPLTKDQLKAVEDIQKDILGLYPMNRLIQGDVGCGKSIVAIIAILFELSAGYQALLMLPTEILANQQYLSLKNMLSKYGFRIELLTSSTKKRERNEILKDFQEGNIHCIVGTHSLLSNEVIPKRLGIAVIDEQHKFGVSQRKALVEKYKDVDALYLTATPIPRTLGLTFFGDLDITSIKGMPEGRLPINTKIISYHKLNSLIRFVKERIEAGEKAYVVCPLITSNEDYDAMPVEEAERIFAEGLGENIVKAIHGKMAGEEKKSIMDSFMQGSTKVLISTTVIEVGVNNPFATMMIILDADRFGLAQIHQLRGRVGRSNLQSYCALVTKRENNERLKALEEISDGFGIADIDFKLRGPGNYFGEEQSGFLGLEYADFETDYTIWEYARKDALAYLDDYLSGKEKSIRFDKIFIDNQRVGFKTN